MPTYDSEPGPSLEFTRHLSEGASSTVSVLSLGSHTGTHVDAPAHFVEGRETIDAIPADVLVGEAFVAEHTGEGHVTADDLDALGQATCVLLRIVEAGAGRSVFLRRVAGAQSELESSPGEPVDRRDVESELLGPLRGSDRVGPVLAGDREAEPERAGRRGAYVRGSSRRRQAVRSAGRGGVPGGRSPARI